ncbi:MULTISPECIES: hypothetical protein [Elizabethkingia]|uniref:hypothetical protein n=1 Tax=Elizabethkingia TaxID=308865 RepID=UPI000D4442E6|nr:MULTISPECIES: hypothetical protein [Elizabethkingia]MCL1665841.1 hypothetical protein [Elizabethkingia ursingii]MCL1670978.1 hypothetical protein [Elizabethkingia ursingii]PUB32617.1 hypothetical protein C8J95_10416 [Elizabethkingia sp. YR214]
MKKKSYKSFERLDKTVLGESRVFIKENDLEEIRKLISDSENDISEDELRGIVTILNTIIRLGMKEFIIR